MRKLRITQPGEFVITFLDSHTMRTLNRRLTGRHRLTDVLSFRYADEPVIGEILIAPEAARRYATQHGLAYREELARYVLHGLLHWLGHDDRTLAQQRTIRALEDQLLTECTPTRNHQ